MSSLDNKIRQFSEHGFLNLGSVVDASVCNDLLAKIRARQQISSDIFLSEEAFDENPVYKGVNPLPGRNIVEDFPEELVQIEASEGITSILDRILGSSYEILNKKVICGVPEKWIPEWVLKRISENAVNNLGAYVKPGYRNITYFYGIDFHQDIIDWPGRDLDFITLYVYLHDVSEKDAPLQLLSDSHQLGVDQFPHELDRVDQNGNICRYRNSVSGDVVSCQVLTITGKTGNVGLWHSCTLHGTQPNENDAARLSLRYLITRLPGSKGAVIDEMNRKMQHREFTNDMRLDLGQQGEPKMKQNYLYRRFNDKK